MSAPRPSITERTPVRAHALARLVRREDVAVADHRHAALGGHAPDQVPVGRLAVALLARAAVDRDRGGAVLLAGARDLATRSPSPRSSPRAASRSPGSRPRRHRGRDQPAEARRACAAGSRRGPRRVIWSIGQPQLRSTKRAPRDSASRAPSARLSGLLSASCTPKNGSSGWLLQQRELRRAAAQQLAHDRHLADRDVGAQLGAQPPERQVAAHGERREHDRVLERRRVAQASRSDSRGAPRRRRFRRVPPRGRSASSAARPPSPGARNRFASTPVLPVVHLAVASARRVELARACRARRRSPFSMTRIWSARRIVERRWAITNVVRPFMSQREPLLDERLRLGVEARGGLVEDQDPRVGEDRPRDRDALALAPREPHAALADDRVVAVRESARRTRRRARCGRPRATSSAAAPRAARTRRSRGSCRRRGTSPAGRRRGGRGRSRAARVARSTPSTSTRPDAGAWNAQTRPMIVDLPAPGGADERGDACPAPRAARRRAAPARPRGTRSPRPRTRPRRAWPRQRDRCAAGPRPRAARPSTSRVRSRPASASVSWLPIDDDLEERPDEEAEEDRVGEERADGHAAGEDLARADVHDRRAHDPEEHGRGEREHRRGGQRAEDVVEDAAHARGEHRRLARPPRGTPSRRGRPRATR